MTSELEKEMNLISARRKSKEEVVEHSRELLSVILNELFKNKLSIGNEIRTALTEDRIVGQCPECKEGKLRIILSKNNKWFLGCTAYPKCTNSYPLPQKGKIFPAKETCKFCGLPVVSVQGKKFKFKMCISPDCKSKNEWKKKIQQEKN
jgi:DNA topoisomerase-1